jgi:hypothetical protein
MIFESKLHWKFGENLFLALLKKPLNLYDNTVTKLHVRQGKISVKIGLVQGKLFTRT